jgi:very-short-patch-repair endonuclease
MAHDERRDGWLARQGIRVQRVGASSVFQDADEVADAARLLALEIIQNRADLPSPFTGKGDRSP